MQPSGALGAHDLLVRLGDAWRKRKKEKNAATGISRILSGLTCGFLGRRSALAAATEHAKAPGLLNIPKKMDHRMLSAVLAKNKK